MNNEPLKRYQRNSIIYHGTRSSSGRGRGWFFLNRLFRRDPDRRPRRPRNYRKLFQYLLIIWLAIFFAGSIATVGLFAWFSRDLPDPNQINTRNVAETTQILDRTGTKVLYEIHGDQKRTVVELNEISDYAKQATVAVEDKRFYTDRVFDLRAILRAVYTDLVQGQKAQGASTITQQFIKNSILTNEKTITRKLKELILAYEMERKFTKDQILKLYLNEIPYGSLAYGIESASRTFFAKPAKDLTISESAMLAALPKATTYYSPYGNHLDALSARTKLIIDLMAEQGYITTAQADEAKKDDVVSRVVKNTENIVAPHFVFYAKDQLAKEYGEDAVEKGGLRVITTLDYDKQKIAEKAIADGRKDLKKWKASTAAMTAIDPKTGDILAMVGSADYFDDSIKGKFNAMLGSLQPGSSIKPIVYAAAFEKGYTPDTVLYDVNTTFKNYPTDYTPKNYDGKEHGPMLMKEALAGSLNIPAVKTLYLVGVDNFINFAERFGYTTLSNRSRFGLSLVLGGGEVHPIEHIAAYTAFAQGGIYHAPRAILRVEDRNGKVLFEDTQDHGKKVIEPEIANQIDGIMSDNSLRSFIFGEQNYLTLGERPVAAKTGTTNDFKDAWTIGFTPSLVAGFWVGNADGTPMKQGADGSKVAAPLWNRFMKEALGDSPIEHFTGATPVTTGKPILDGDRSAQNKVKIDKISGKLATDATPPDLIEERGYGAPHDILYFVNKDDPRGPQPTDPGSDPQFASWEAGVADWAKRNNIITDTLPPTEYDDVHNAASTPTVSFSAPREGDTVATRNPNVVIDASAPRGIAKVEYLVDGESVATVDRSPWGGSIPIPNRFTKGFHTLSARVYDDVGNRGQADVTINLTAESSPLQLLWLNPVNGQDLDPGKFPFDIKFSVDDPKVIDQLTLVVKDELGQVIAEVGNIKTPSLPNFSLQWNSYPGAGRYFIVAHGTMTDGSSGEDSIIINVK